MCFVAVVLSCQVPLVVETSQARHLCAPVLALSTLLLLRILANKLTIHRSSQKQHFSSCKTAQSCRRPKTNQNQLTTKPATRLPFLF